jgi:hypothetical protein
MDATDLLTTFAQLGVGLAGFSGIVVVLGSRARGEWSSHERRLLDQLLADSGEVILWSLFPLVLLIAGVGEPTVWLLSSASWALTHSAIFLLGVRAVRQATGSLQNPGLIIYAFVAAFAAIAAQIANVAWLRVAWPHVAAVSFNLTLSFLVFVQLLRQREE